MLSALFLGVVAPNSGILVADGMAVGRSEGGKWSSFEIVGEGNPKPAKSVIDGIAANGSWKLTPSGAAAERVTLSVVDFAPMGMGWGLSGESNDGIYWLGGKPGAVKQSPIAKTNATYVNAVKQFLTGKGIRNAKPVIDSIMQADLDGNGTNEVVISFGHKDVRSMQDELSPYDNKKFPGAYAGVIIRYVSGGAKTHEAWWADGRKGAIAATYWLRGIWDLDGLPGAELVMQSRGWESKGYHVSKFSGGRSREVASIGYGV